MRTWRSVTWVVIVAAGLPACLQADDDSTGEPTEAPVETIDSGSPELTSITPITPKAGVFEVGVIPDLGVGCPAGSAEIVIRMDDEDDGNTSSRSGFVGKTNSGETSSATRFYFCKVDGTLFKPFSTSTSAADQRDDYAVLKLGTTCPAGSQEFSRHFDNEDSDNRNFFTGVISPNVSNQDTTLYFCLFRYAASGVATMSAFPNLGSGFRYGVFGPSDFNRGALAFGTIRSDDEDSGNTSTYTVPSDALSAAKRIIYPDSTVSHGATILRVIRAR
jgi:hypothetical protein